MDLVLHWSGPEAGAGVWVWVLLGLEFGRVCGWPGLWLKWERFVQGADSEQVGYSEVECSAFLKKPSVGRPEMPGPRFVLSVFYVDLFHQTTLVEHVP